MRAIFKPKPTRSCRCLAAAIAMLVCTVALPGVSLAGSNGERPGWAEAMPSNTSVVFRMESSGLRAISKSVAARAGLSADERPLRCDHPVSALVGGLLTDAVEEVVENGSRHLAAHEFAHVDAARPLVVGFDSRAASGIRERIRLGLPPSRVDRVGTVRQFRAIVPADDAEALADEFEQFCAESSPALPCSDRVEWRAVGDAVWIDYRHRGGSGPDASESSPNDERGSDPDYFEPRTPAVRALFGADAGFAVYARPGAVRRFAIAAKAERIGYLAEWMRESDAEDRPYRIRALRRTIAETMVVEASSSPSTREIRDMTVRVEGDGERYLRADAIQSYTRYGAALARAARVELALPRFGMPRPVATGAFRFDVPSARKAADAPSWMERDFIGGERGLAASRFFAAGDGVVSISSLLEQPISTAKAGARLLESADLPGIARLEPYLRVVGGAFSVDVDPARVLQGGPGLEGGLVLALTESEAVGTYMNLVDLAQSALGVAIRTDTRTQGSYTILELRVDTERTFSRDGAERARRFEGGVALDRLLAKIEVLDRRGGPDDETRRLMRFFDGAGASIDSGPAARRVTIEVGGARDRDFELSKNRDRLGMPEARPQCLRRAVDRSMQLYIEEVVGYNPSSGAAESMVRAPGGADDEAVPEVDLSGRARASIESALATFERAREACGETGRDAAADRVDRIRRYWQRVLEATAATYPGAQERIGERSEDSD